MYTNDKANVLSVKLEADNFKIIECNIQNKNFLDYDCSNLINRTYKTFFSESYHNRFLKELVLVKANNVITSYIPVLNKNNASHKVKIILKYEIENNHILMSIIDLGFNDNIDLLYENIFMTNRVMIAITTFEDEVFVKVNKELCEVLEYDEEEIIGLQATKINLYSNQNQRDELLSLFDKYGFIEDYELVLNSKYGKQYDCLFSVSIIEVNNEKYFLTIATNITDLKNSQRKVSDLFKQQKLLADISQLFNSTNRLETILGYALRIIGEHINVSRVYIFENTEDNNLINNTFEWCNEGVEAQKSNLQNIPLDDFKDWMDMLKYDGRIFAENISSLPRFIYETLSAQNIKSILVYPLIAQDEIFGFIGFDECNENKVWSEREVQLLRTISNVISNAFERRNIYQETKKSNLRLQQLINDSGDADWELEYITGDFVINPNLLRDIGLSEYSDKFSFEGWKKLIHPDDLESFNKIFDKNFDGLKSVSKIFYRIKTGESSWRWILNTISLVKDDAAQKNFSIAVGVVICLENSNLNSLSVDN
jgi:PAS domain S-box-containing protein